MLDVLNPALPFIAVALAVVAGLALSWLLRKVVLRLNRKRPERRPPPGWPASRCGSRCAWWASGRRWD
ncbi:hypothetical protein NG819_20340 [Pseudarthrobacter sp. Fe7]|nr:hypothetical protein NG819_20340 [Pseudarthrobacter sp. Fe7]